eukprot:COSAG02_NODE_1309_length_13330_cov_61.652483_1_plen_88_part_00
MLTPGIRPYARCHATSTGHTCGPRRLGPGIPVGPRRLGPGIPVGPVVCREADLLAPAIDETMRVLLGFANSTAQESVTLMVKAAGMC